VKRILPKKPNLILLTFFLIVLIFYLNSLLIGTRKPNQENLKNSINPNTQIVVNQVGYYPNLSKIALLLNSNNPADEQIQILDTHDHQTNFIIPVGTKIQDSETKDIVQGLDFTSFNQEGRYYLKYKNLVSYPFTISKDIYKEPFKKMLRSYYLQRCGVAVHDPITGIHHPPCHLQDGILAHKDTFHKSGHIIIARGGWHDAGDYGKYVAPTAVTIGRLLNLYEQYPRLFSDKQLTIPESGNGIPDLLDEVKVGLNWLLTMQRQDGAVYRKLSGKEWPADISPEQDKQARFIYGISTPETASFAAVMAMATRTYAQDPKFAEKCLKAAKKAWSFLEKEPAPKVDWVKGDDQGSGEYLINFEAGKLKTNNPNRLWAAAELFITTGDSAFEKSFSKISANLSDWIQPAPLGMIDYLMQHRRQSSGVLKREIRAKVLNRADYLMKKVSLSRYHLANDLFIWGSNKIVAEEGITLFYAYRLTGNPEYLRAAIDQLDYLLGRNHFNQSFVSGVGTNFVKNVHHRLAKAAKLRIPGLLVGGPNAATPDNIAPKNRGSLSYVDDSRSYGTNEYAIDYNASLISLMGLVMAAANIVSL